MMLKHLAHELGLTGEQVERTVALLDDGNTVPFITRYRKEVTGGLDEDQLRRLVERLGYLRNLEARRSEVSAALESSGHLTDELAAQLAAATTLQAIEDLYLPFRPKRRTRAQIAREQGLQPLADLLLAQATPTAERESTALPFVNADQGVADVEAAYAGARDIIAETVAETATVRQAVREATRRTALIRTQRRDDGDAEGKYQTYYEFSGAIQGLAAHRILAINRGEREGALKVNLDANHDAFIATIQRRFAHGNGWMAAEVRHAVADGYRRLLLPAIERDLRNELTERAEIHALQVFAANLRGLLLQPPLRGRVVLGLDPGYRTGCKLAVVDPTGRYLAGETIYLHQPERARATLQHMIEQYRVHVIAIGNGTASRESEALVAEVLRVVPDVKYVIVSEAGASVYSTSETARAEFPNLDATQRGNISIARRLQDPLAELVKIEPKALGVGLYQHDVDQRRLDEQLGTVIESCVNYVGVDLNTASAALLGHVAGLTSKTAKAIVTHRDTNGPFATRRQLRDVKGLGPKSFEQAAGFLRIPDAADPLDQTAIHPESYNAARRLIELADGTAGDLDLPRVAAILRRRIASGVTDIATLAAAAGIGEPTLHDLLEAMEKPGRDPRHDAPPPILRSDVLKLEDLQPGMWLKGTVRNVVDFGAFVDIGLKHDGLVHVSELADRFVKNPLDVVHVGDIVDVRVLSVDPARGRVALSRKKQ